MQEVARAARPCPLDAGCELRPRSRLWLRLHLARSWGQPGLCQFGHRVRRGLRGLRRWLPRCWLRRRLAPSSCLLRRYRYSGGSFSRPLRGWRFRGRRDVDLKGDWSYGLLRRLDHHLLRLLAGVWKWMARLGNTLDRHAGSRSKGSDGSAGDIYLVLGPARQGSARCGAARSGWAGRGSAWRGVARARRGSAWLGEPRLGRDRLGEARHGRGGRKAPSHCAVTSSDQKSNQSSARLGHAFEYEPRQTHASQEQPVQST